MDNESLAHCPAVRAARVRCGALQGCARRLASIVLYVAGLVQKTIPDEASFAALLTQGSSKRATASTNMNAVSSRSHAILTVTLHRQVLEEKHLAVEGAHQMETTSHFRLVDLAGSERAKRTNASGKR